MSNELLPCPFCGCTDVWQYITFSSVKIECRDCGAKTDKNCACVMYKRDNPPQQLVGVETYEPTLLVIQTGTEEIPYPDHGYVGVSALTALKAYGAVDRWNQRLSP